jgi:hypothetical protein
MNIFTLSNDKNNVQALQLNVKRCCLALSVFIAGCSDITPFKLAESQKMYDGVWQHFYEAKSDNSFEHENTLFIINSDGSALYKTCDVAVNKPSGARTAARTTTYLDSAFLTALTQNELTLTQEAGFINVDFDFEINKAPFEANGTWNMIIDGVQVSKINDANVTQLIAHECPEIDDIKLEVEGK